MSAIPRTRSDYAETTLSAACAIGLGALGRATLDVKTATLTTFFFHQVTAEYALNLAQGLSTKYWRPISDNEITAFGFASLGFSATLYLYGASGALLPLAIAGACIKRNSSSWQNTLLSSGLCIGEIIGLASYTNFIPSTISLLSKITLATNITRLTNQALEAYSGHEIDKNDFAFLQLIASTKLAVSCYFGDISIGTFAAGILGMCSYVHPTPAPQN